MSKKCQLLLNNLVLPLHTASFLKSLNLNIKLVNFTVILQDTEPLGWRQGSLQAIAPERKVNYTQPLGHFTTTVNQDMTNNLHFTLVCYRVSQ